MERILLIKKSGNVTWWEVDVTTMPIQKVLEIIISEQGDDYEVKRAPEHVIDECLEQIKTKAIKGEK